MSKKLKSILLVLLLIGGSLLLWFKLKSVDSTQAIASTLSTKIDQITPISIPTFYAQRDKRWANDSLGKTTETMGEVGCLVSSVAMNFSYYGIDVTPKSLNDALTKVEGYTPRGWLIWSKLSTVTNKQISTSFPTLSHDTIYRSLHKGTPVLAKVYIHKVIPHWVLVVGVDSQGEYLILDPLTKGGVSTLSSYGKYIYAIRILEKA